MRNRASSPQLISFLPPHFHTTYGYTPISNCDTGVPDLYWEQTRGSVLFLILTPDLTNQQGPDSGEELIVLEGFDQVVIGS